VLVRGGFQSPPPRAHGPPEAAGAAFTAILIATTWHTTEIPLNGRMCGGVVAGVSSQGKSSRSRAHCALSFEDLSPP